MKNLLLLAIFWFHISSVCLSPEDKLNKVFGYAGAFPLPSLVDLGLGYDRIFSNRWALSTNLHS